MKISDNKIIAHRGESYDAPENTLSSINLAWQRGVKAVEIDIRLTKDNEIVVIHDSDTKRVTGIKRVIRNSSLQELKSLNAGEHKGSQWRNEQIPTLTEVLKTVPQDCRLIIEIKSDRTILNKLKSELEASGLQSSQIELIAFNSETLALAKKIMPQYKMLWLLGLDYFWPHWVLRVDEQKIMEKLAKLNLDGIDVWAGRLLTRSFIYKFKQEGYLVYAWTIDKTDKAKALIEQGIDGLTTNRAGWMIKELNSEKTDKSI